jgi:hypothetical protein
LRDGTIDAIATDHAPHHADEKALEYDRAPMGITGLETAIGLAFGELVDRGVIDLVRLVELCSTNPAKIFNLKESRNFKSRLNRRRNDSRPEPRMDLPKTPIQNRNRKIRRLTGEISPARLWRRLSAEKLFIADENFLNLGNLIAD